MALKIVAVCGGSGSGKTTLARSLSELLGESTCSVLSQDHYYIDQSHRFKADGEDVNFDHPEALDFKLLHEHLKMLRSGQTINVPIYDFVTHKRLKESTVFPPKPVVIVDGTMILSQSFLRSQFDVSVYVDTPEDIRFDRRFQRDRMERGRSPEGIRKQFINQVKPMHDQFVEPTKAHAQFVLSGVDPFELLLPKWLVQVGLIRE